MSPIRPPPRESGEHAVEIPRAARTPVIPSTTPSGTINAPTREQIELAQSEADASREEKETMLPCPRCGGKGSIPK